MKSVFVTGSILMATFYYATSGSAPSGHGASPAGAASRERQPVITIESIPARAVLLRTVKGGFEQHEARFREFMEYAEANYRTVGRCFGIYPTDPDAVNPRELTWQIGVEVGTGPAGHIASADRRPDPNRIIAQLARPASDYVLLVLPGVRAAVVNSTVARSSVDGLLLLKWLPGSGYVQVSPTRMEYLSHEGPAASIATRIIVPVSRRRRSIDLPPKS